MKIALTGLVLLDASFRHTVDPFSSDAEGPNPEAEVPMEISLLRGEGPNAYAVVLRVNVEAPPSRYAVSVAYAAFLTFDLEGEASPHDFDNRVMATGASMLMPYCRELISNLTGRAKFGPVWIGPTNINSLIAQSENSERAAPTP